MKKVVAVLGTLALVLMVTSGAFAAKSMLTGKDIQNGSITGLDVKDGSLRVSDLSASARAALQTRTGAAGQPGARGENGAKGEIGAKGDVGSKGETGAKGDTGGKGDNGSTGASGKDGANGRDGAPGKVGPAGPQGEPGPAGPAGPSGVLNHKIVEESVTLPSYTSGPVRLKVTANCPAGWVAIGGGARIEGDTWPLLIQDSYPSADGASWIVTYRFANDQGGGSTGNFVASAQCVEFGS